jgi:hypothetical protein
MGQGDGCFLLNLGDAHAAVNDDEENDDDGEDDKDDKSSLAKIYQQMNILFIACRIKINLPYNLFPPSYITLFFFLIMLELHFQLNLYDSDYTELG